MTTYRYTIACSECNDLLWLSTSLQEPKAKCIETLRLIDAMGQRLWCNKCDGKSFAFISLIALNGQECWPIEIESIAEIAGLSEYSMIVDNPPTAVSAQVLSMLNDIKNGHTAKRAQRLIQ